MTTNVYDGLRAIMSSDSRWSRDIVDDFGELWVLFCDDTGFNKITIVDDFIFMFAGDMGNISAWKKWANERNWNTEPPVKSNIAYCIVNKNDWSIMDHFGQSIVQTSLDGSRYDALFAGTGHSYAYNCWSTNKDAIKAVDSAKISDNYSGGVTCFISSENNNIYDDIIDNSFVDVKYLQEKAFIMKKEISNQATTISLNQAISQDARFNNFKNNLAGGKIELSAPLSAEIPPIPDDKIADMLNKLKTYKK